MNRRLNLYRLAIAVSAGLSLGAAALGFGGEAGPAIMLGVGVVCALVSIMPDEAE